MRPYTKRLEHYDKFNGGTSLQGQIEYNDTSLIEVAREELTALTNFIGILKREREAILSFSLGDITEINNQKETIVQKLAALKKRRKAYTGRAPGYRDELQNREYLILAGTIKLGMREARTCLKKNRVLLSMSAGWIKSVMGFIADSLKGSSTTYGRENRRGPALFSRRV